MRAGVGVCDVSTLGKIDMQGPDAGEFLDRVYTNTFSTLAVGKARYGLMLREDGFVLDDGTTSRLAERSLLHDDHDRERRPRCMQHLEFCHQVLWPELDVQMVSVTEQWAQFSIAGPRSRDVLRGVVDPQHDISNEAFPYMAAREVTAMGGIQARLFRLSFSGELAYELAVPARYGDALIRRIMAAGARVRHHALRHRGARRHAHREGPRRRQRDQRADDRARSGARPHDVDARRTISAASWPDAAGAARARPAGARRPQAGRSRGAAARRRAFPARRAPSRRPANDQGYMTSVAFSPMLGHWIGLGLLARGPPRIGERVRALRSGAPGDELVEVCDPVFYDPAGERLRG